MHGDEESITLSTHIVSARHGTHASTVRQKGDEKKKHAGEIKAAQVACAPILLLRRLRVVRVRFDSSASNISCVATHCTTKVSGMPPPLPPLFDTVATLECLDGLDYAQFADKTSQSPLQLATAICNHSRESCRNVRQVRQASIPKVHLLHNPRCRYYSHPG